MNLASQQLTKVGYTKYMFRENFTFSVLNKCYFQVITPHLMYMYLFVSGLILFSCLKSRGGKTQQYVFPYQKLNHENQVSGTKHTKMCLLHLPSK